jgi:outer membrane biosynthesis protein TonB
MYFDFEDYRPDINPVGRAISWREGVLISIIVHLAVVILLLLLPRVFPEPAPRQALLTTPSPQESTTFVFVQPRVDAPAPKAPDRAEASDLDRMARTPERVEKPENPLPLSRGNSPQRVEAQPPPEPARGRGPQPEPLAGPQTPPQAEPLDSPQKFPESPSGLTFPSNKPQTQARAGEDGRSTVPGGVLGDAVKNLQRYVATPQFRNLQGGGTSQGAFQFDTKGVEFGPWLKRFVQQVYSNWNVPQAAMSLKGRVVITFNVHKSGALTDVTVVGRCDIDSFNTAAYGSLISSNPTQPLPPEYPDEKAFFTVTFYYNEQPQ